MKLFRLLALPVVALASNLPIIASAQDLEEASAQDLEEIVVTALRRGDQVASETPIAVTALAGERLEHIGANSLIDYIQLAPGASMLESVPGLNVIQMRGVSAGVGESNVGMYLDEMPFSYINQASKPDVRAFDLERVEVLRGPQGTLYGAGAIAGVIRAIAKDPVLDAVQFKADVSGSSTTDGEDNSEINVALNIPIVEDRLAVRLVGMFEDQSGWIDLSNLGIDDANDTEVSNFRLKVLGQATDNLTITFLGWMSRIETGNSPSSFDDRTSDNFLDLTSDLDYDMYNLKFDYEGNGFDFVSSTSLQSVETELVSEFFGFPLTSLLDPEGLTQEFRLHSTSDSDWQWTTGVFYRESDQVQSQDSPILAVFGLDPVLQEDDVESWAAFGEVTRIFANGKADVTVGLRYFEEDRTTTNLFPVRSTMPIMNSFDALTPRFNVSYRPTDDSMVYFNYGQGFRSGINQFPLSLSGAAAFGLHLPSAADEEILDSFEIGLKGKFFDDRLTVDATVFTLEWDDLQLVVPVVLGALGGVVNAAKAESTGVELAVSWRATDNLTLGINGSVNNAEVSSDVVIDAAVLDPVTGAPSGLTTPVQLFSAGDPLNNVPEYTVSTTLDYSRELGGTGWLGVVNLIAQHNANLESRNSGLVNVSEDITRTDFRVGAENENWGIYLFADNLFDEDRATSPPAPPTTLESGRLRPRTIGLNLKYRYE